MANRQYRGAARDNDNDTEPSAPPLGALVAMSVEGKPDLQPGAPTKLKNPEKPSTDWVTALLGAVDVHPYVVLHFMIAAVLFSWVSMGLDFGLVLTNLLPPLMSYLGKQTTLLSGWTITKIWTLSPHWQDRVPIMAAFMFTILVGIPGFFGAVFFYTEEYVPAAILFGIVVAEFIYVLTVDMQSFMQCCACDKGSMSEDLHSEWREVARKFFGMVISFSVIYAVMTFDGLRKHTVAVYELDANRQLFLDSSRPIVLGQFNAMRCASNMTRLDTLSEHEILTFIKDPRSKSPLLDQWANLDKQEQDLKLFSPWIGFSFSGKADPTSVAAFIDKDILGKADRVMFRLSVLWAALLVVWYLALPSVSKQKRTVAELALISLLLLLLNCLIELVVLSYVWEPTVGKLKNMLTGCTWVPAALTWGGLSLVALLAGLKSVGCVCCTR